MTKRGAFWRNVRPFAKFFVRSLFHALPAVQYDDLIRVPCYFQAMSNENEGAFIDLRLLIILSWSWLSGAGRFVHD